MAHRKYVLLTSTIGFIAGIAGGAMMLVLRPTSDILGVKRIELVDSRGSVFGTWGMDANEGVVLAFLGGDKKQRLTLASHHNSVFIQMFGADERPRMTLASDESGKPSVNMGDETSLSRLSLGFQANDSPSPNDDSWGLVFPKSAFLPWLNIGVSRDPTSGLMKAGLRITGEHGNTWTAPPRNLRTELKILFAGYRIARGRSTGRPFR